MGAFIFCERPTILDTHWQTVFVRQVAAHQGEPVQLSTRERVTLGMQEGLDQAPIGFKLASGWEGGYQVGTTHWVVPTWWVGP